ncbi:uncharacterized protein LOC141903242 [Tubulanus polymorphus]|uniref:uncharacterized protein LOC141903242 n=1 Tax=Tubulanus polymorphus TaxID=672921 RepID=UPI003DA55A7C
MYPSIMCVMSKDDVAVEKNDKFEEGSVISENIDVSLINADQDLELSVASQESTVAEGSVISENIDVSIVSLINADQDLELSVAAQESTVDVTSMNVFSSTPNKKRSSPLLKVAEGSVISENIDVSIVSLINADQDLELSVAPQESTVAEGSVISENIDVSLINADQDLELSVTPQERTDGLESLIIENVSQQGGEIGVGLFEEDMGSLLVEENSHNRSLYDEDIDLNEQSNEFDLSTTLNAITSVIKVDGNEVLESPVAMDCVIKPVEPRKCIKKGMVLEEVS